MKVNLVLFLFYPAWATYYEGLNRTYTSSIYTFTLSDLTIFPTASQSDAIDSKLCSYSDYNHITPTKFSVTLNPSNCPGSFR